MQKRTPSADRAHFPCYKNLNTDWVFQIAKKKEKRPNLSLTTLSCCCIASRSSITANVFVKITFSVWNLFFAEYWRKKIWRKYWRKSVFRWAFQCAKKAGRVQPLRVDSRITEPTKELLQKRRVIKKNIRNVEHSLLCRLNQKEAEGRPRRLQTSKKW